MNQKSIKIITLFYIFFTIAFCVTIPEKALAAPPQLLGAATTEDGTKILLSFDKEMAEPAGSHMQFLISINGSISAATNATLNATDTIELSLATPVAHGNTVTVTYAAGTVAAADGELLASFVLQPVTNNVPAPPAPPAPVFVSAATSNDGARVQITFSKAMADPADSLAGFTVMVNGSLRPLSYAALNHNNAIIDLYLSSPVINGNTITVAYTAGTVKAADGGVLASFGAQNVTNNVPAVTPSAPVFVSAATNTDGSRVLLTFNKAMANPISNFNRFTVTVNGYNNPVTSAALNANTSIVELYLTTPVNYNDSVTVAYSAGNLTSADEGVLASFGARPVTNNVPVSATPTLVSAATSTDGSRVLLTFSKPMSNPSNNYYRFSVKVNGYTNAVTYAYLGASAQTIELYLTSPVRSGDYVTVAYSAGTLTAADGTFLSSFSARAVTNNASGASSAAPAFVSAVTSTDGNKVLVTFSKAMSNPSGNYSRFTVVVNGYTNTVTYAYPGSYERTIELYLSTPVQIGDNVTVAYTAGTLTSTDGYPLHSFSARSVTNNVQTSTTYPTFVSARTSTDGDKIIITFSKAMSDPYGNYSRFTVTVNGYTRPVSYAYSSSYYSSSIELYLSTPVDYDDTVRVAYSAGTLTSTDGYPLHSFSARYVTNNVTGSYTSSLAFVSARTSTDGNKIIVTFNKPLSDPYGNYSRFNVAVNGYSRTVSNAYLNSYYNETIELYLSTPVNYNDSVTISYTEGTLTSADGDNLSSFSARAVTNNVTSPYSAPPTFVSAITSTDGGKVLVTFNRPMSDPSSHYSSFRINVDGVNNPVTSAALSTDPATIALSLNTPVSYDSRVTVAYTSGSLKAANGYSLSSFSARTVTNNVSNYGGPSLQNAVTNPDGSKVILTFSKSMSNPYYDYLNFYVYVNGTVNSIKKAALGSSSTMIELTLNTPVRNGQNVTVSYSPGTVKSSDGKLLAGFSSRSVTNKVGTAPVPQSAETNYDGTNIYLTFSKAMASPSSSYPAFKVSVNGIPNTVTGASLSTDPYKIVLSLSTPIAKGSTVSLSYTPGSVTASDGTALASFTKSVSNLSNYSKPDNQPVFHDTGNHWAKDSISRLAGMGVITGYGDGSFQPDNLITRAEFCTVLVKALKLPLQSGKTFRDTTGHWAENYIATAVAKGFVGGYSNTQFGPDDRITREQMAVMLVNAANLSTGTTGKKFSDESKVSSWAKNAMAAAVANGIINGYTDGTLRPQHNTTRAEAATTIVKILK